jgi:hypothetical protein
MEHEHKYEHEYELDTDQHKVSDKPNTRILSFEVTDCVVIALHIGDSIAMYHMAGSTPANKINNPDAFDDQYTLNDLCDNFVEYPENVYVVSGLNSKKSLVKSISKYLQNRYSDCNFSTLSLDSISDVSIISGCGDLQIIPCGI